MLCYFLFVPDQEMFWRISDKLSAEDLEAIADGLTVGDDGKAVDSERVQQVVSRVFPNIGDSRPSTSGKSKQKTKKEKKTKRKKKDKKKKKKNGK